MRLKKYFNLKFGNAKMEDEYVSIKARNIIPDYIVTMGFLFVLSIFLMIPSAIGSISTDLYISVGTIGLILLLAALHKYCKKYVSLISLIILVFYTITRYIVVKDGYFRVLRGTLYLQGYFIGTIQHIIISRLPKTKYKILGAILGFLTRMGLLIGITEPKILEPFPIIRHILMDSFLIYMFYSQEKTERNVFQKFYENREELVKFKELLADSLPISVTVLDINLKKCLFSNNMFLSSFNQKTEAPLHFSEPLHISTPHTSTEPFRVPFNFLYVDIATIREIGSPETKIGPLSFTNSCPYVEEVLEMLVKGNVLQEKPLSLTAFHQDLEQISNSSSRSYEIMLKRIKWDGEEAIAVILNDITHQEKLIALKVANRNKDKMIATISHELRTPLHGIIGIIETTEKKVDDEQVQTCLSMCSNHAHLLLSLVNSIVDFHQMSTGNLKLNPKEIDIRQMMSRLFKLFEFQCVEKKLLFEATINEDVPSHIVTDENRLKQILVNIVSNAIKFTSRGGITLEVTKEFENSKYLNISVRDTGIGIKKEQMEKLFKIHSQVQDKESVSKSGVGLGLTISNALALMLNGNAKGIEVISEYEKGSQFDFLVLADLETDLDLKNIESKFSKGSNEKIKEAYHKIRGHRRMKSIMLQKFQKQKVGTLEDNNLSNQDEFTLAEEYEGSENPLNIQSRIASYASIQKKAGKDLFDVSSKSNYLMSTKRLKNQEVMSFETHRALMSPSETNTHRETIDLYIKSKELLSPKLIEAGLSEEGLVVVVDDYPFNLLVARNLIKNLGYSFKTAMGGYEAIDLVKQCAQEKKTIKVIFMDCQMPIIDGYETTIILRKMMEMNEIPKVPIFAWTANNGEEDIKRCYKCGMTGHLSKPTSQEDLLKVLSKLPKTSV